MDPDLQQLEEALRAAHAAGDTASAGRLAYEIRARQASGGDVTKPVRDLSLLHPTAAANTQRLIEEAKKQGVQLAVAETLRSQARQEHLYEQGRSRPGPVVTWTKNSNHAPGRAVDLTATSPDGYKWIQQNAPRFGFHVLGDKDPGHIELLDAPPAAADSTLATARPAPVTSVGAGRHFGPPPAPPKPGREEGVADALALHPLEAQAAAETQGVGSAFFGFGTPLTAAAHFIARALPGGQSPETVSEALDYARGRRETLKENHPGAYWAGVGAGTVLGAAPAKAVAKTVSKVAPKLTNIFATQTGQTYRNIARIAANGAAAAGLTAGNEEGAAAVPAAAATGAVAAPLAVGAAAAVGNLAERLEPASAAIRILAKRLGEPAQAIADRYNAFVQTMGRAPRLVEIMSREGAEEMGQISRVRSGAGEIFRKAEEDAAMARPAELAKQLRDGRVVTSEPAQAALLVPTREATKAVVDSRVRSTATAEIGRRDVSMDRLMNRIGGHVVPVTDKMLEVLQHPDVWGSLDSALRRKLTTTIEAGKDLGSVGIDVRTWDKIRQDLAGRAGAGSGQIYANLRNKVRDYVGSVVPEYARGLQEFGRRTDVAAGITAGRSALTKDTREFVDLVRTAGGGTPTTAQREGTRVATQAGMRVGARSALANLLSGTERQVENGMRKIATDSRLRENLQAVLSEQELAQLERLGERYGRRLDLTAGVKLGQKVMDATTTEGFRDAVAQTAATHAGRAGVSAGARSAVVDAAIESPGRAAQVAADLAQNPGFLQRLETALGRPEAARMKAIGETSTTAARRLAVAAPQGSTQAATKAREAAETVQQVIQAGVVATGRASGAFRANLMNSIAQRTTLSKKAATKLAEMATDPETAHIVIDRLRAAGVTIDQVRQLYTAAATAVGIQVGRQ